MSDSEEPERLDLSVPGAFEGLLDALGRTKKKGVGRPKNRRFLKILDIRSDYSGPAISGVIRCPFAPSSTFGKRRDDIFKDLDISKNDCVLILFGTVGLKHFAGFHHVYSLRNSLSYPLAFPRLVSLIKEMETEEEEEENSSDEVVVKKEKDQEETKKRGRGSAKQPPRAKKLSEKASERLKREEKNGPLKKRKSVLAKELAKLKESDSSDESSSLQELPDKRQPSDWQRLLGFVSPIVKDLEIQEHHVAICGRFWRSLSEAKQIRFHKLCEKDDESLIDAFVRAKFQKFLKGDEPSVSDESDNDVPAVVPVLPQPPPQPHVHQQAQHIQPPHIQPPHIQPLQNQRGWGQGPVSLYNSQALIHKPGYPPGHLSQGRKAVISGQDVHAMIHNYFLETGIHVVSVMDDFDIDRWDGTLHGQPVVRPVCFQRCSVGKDLSLDRNFQQCQNVFRFVLVIPDRDDPSKHRFYFIQTQRQCVDGSTIDRFEHILDNVRNVSKRAPNYWGVFVTHFEGDVREENDPKFNDACASNPDRARVLRLETFHKFVHSVMSLAKWM